MAKSEYDWEIGSPPPEIQKHSLVKHRIVRDYLLSYTKILAADPRQDTLRLTLVDGFAGGGIYRLAGTTEEHEGSPFILLRACEEAEYWAGERRKKPFNLKTDFFFVEKKKQNFDYLEQALKKQGYGPKFGSSIFPMHADINDKIGEITEFIARKGRAGRSIFLLDQYGYGEVPGALIQGIFRALPRAEVILTFYIDALITYLNTESKATLEKLGLAVGSDLEELRRKKASDKRWRRWIQARLYRNLVDACGARFFTPFFIRAEVGHGDYWLIHLSMHQRARGAMVDLHWAENNHFIHFGGAGLDMLGYSAGLDETESGQQSFEFLFDESARTRSISALRDDLPRLIAASDEGITFEQLFGATCNETPATEEIYRQTIFELAQYKEIKIIGAKGQDRRTSNTIGADDRILISKQGSFFPRKPT